MLRCLIVAESPAMAAALRLDLMRGDGVSETQIAIREVGKAPASDEVYREFNILCDWIEGEIDEACPLGVLPDLVVLSDLGAYEANQGGWLTPLSGAGWGEVLGLLILSFPEIHWILAAHGAAPPLPPTSKLTGIEFTWNEAWHFSKPGVPLDELVERHKEGFMPLLDPTGLRCAIRHCLREKENCLKDDKNERPKVAMAGVPLRFAAAAAIDEEIGCALLHAYAAYRFGFRVHVVTAFALMKRLFGDQSDYHASLVIEDFFLNFPDHKPDDFSSLAIRKKHCPKLDDIDARVFVTAGWKDKYRVDNKTHLLSKRSTGQWNCIRHKPIAGIYNLWEQTGLGRRLREGRVRGFARGFDWPPKRVDQLFADDTEPHSAPGRLLEVANRLIQRAKRVGADVHSPVTAVYCAVLAIDALELLVDRTPTTAIEALLLKHQFEVLAECQFSGVEYHISMEPRLQEIEREANAISQRFHRDKQETASLNAQMQIINKLIAILREHNQFDEEQLCMIKARHLHNTLWMRQNHWRLSLAPALRYTEFLLRGLPNFFCAVAVWLILFSGAFALIKGYGGAQTNNNDPRLDALGQTISSFFGAEPFASANTLWQITTTAAVVVGVVHVSMLTAHLYSVMARK